MDSINFHLSAASLFESTSLNNDTQATMGSLEQDVEDMELDEDDLDYDKSGTEICSESSPGSEMDDSSGSYANSVIEQSALYLTREEENVLLQSSEEDEDEKEHSPNNKHVALQSNQLEGSPAGQNTIGEEEAIAEESFGSSSTSDESNCSGEAAATEGSDEEQDEFLVTPLKPGGASWKTSTPFVRQQQHSTFQEPKFESTPRRDVGASYYIDNNSRYTFYESACSRYFNSIVGDEGNSADWQFQTPCGSSLTVKGSARMSATSKLSTVGPQNGQYSNVFEDPKVISTICKHAVNISDLCNLRAVNKTWWTEATKRMVERNKLCLCFNGSGDKVPSTDSLHGGVEKKYYSLEDLKNFNEVLSVKKSFVPVHRVVLYQVNFEEAEVLKFLRLHGHRITHLKIVFRPDTVKQKFWSAFTSHLPKLTILQLSQFPLAWKKDEQAYAHSCYFEHLLGIMFDETFPGELLFGAEDIIQAILQGADRLQHIVNYPVFLNPVVQRERKVGTISSLVFNPDPSTNGRKLENFMSLAAVRHRLEQITIKELEKYAFAPMSAKEAEVLDHLLYMNRKSLNVLHMQPLGFCGNVTMKGKYPSLETLHLFCLSAKVKRRSSINTSFFPPGIGDLSLKFPKLARIEIHDLECKYFASDFPPAVFYPKCLPQVRSLALDFLPTGAGTLEEWKRFAEIIPNVEHLTIKAPLASLGEVLNRSWKYWDKLVHLVIYVKEDGHQYDYPFLDEVITGLTEKICKRLRLKKVKYADTLVNTFRTNHSVKDVKNLNKVDFVFETQDDYERHIQGRPGIMSFLSALYGFHHGKEPINVMYKCVRGKK